MSVILRLSLVSFLFFTIQEGNCFIGFDQIENRLENLEKRTEDLVELSAKSFNLTNGRFDELVAGDSGIKDMIDNLSLKTEDSRISEKLATLEKNQDNMATILSRLIEKLSKLESTDNTILSNQRAAENQISGLASSVSALQNQSKQILKNHFDLVIPSCSTAKVSGIYRLQEPNMDVLCEKASSGEFWLVIQHRYKGETDFYKSKYYYQTGFGTVGSYNEFWLGLEAIYVITNSGDYQLNIGVRNESNEMKYAQYSQFKVSSESDGYRLTIGGYSGTAEDALSSHNNTKFSTFDWNETNCGKTYQGGWWWPSDGCGKSNLNGPYKKLANGYGIEWGSFMKAGTLSRMMIRRK